MVTRIGINGFGRMGRLVVRALARHADLQLVHVNEIHGGPEVAAHLLQFDTVHGRYDGMVAVDGRGLDIDGRPVSFSDRAAPGDVPWQEHAVDLVLDCTGAFRTMDGLGPYFRQGVRKVVVAAPVKDTAALNVVMGCNHQLYDPAIHHVVTAASCTTNALAPVVKVLHEAIGIDRGVITTIHDVTNTQVLVDAPHHDLRRARSALNSLIPTTTGSATAITMIYPELAGKLNGLAVRVPLLNASLVDCVFDLEQTVGRDEVNDLLAVAAAGPLTGILGFEARPLVSADFVNDIRSGIVDGPSTMVVDGDLVKVLIWYDNEFGYVHRMADRIARGRSPVTADGPSGGVALVDYGVVTGAYWAFTLTDGALRMLVLLHFHQLGYSPVTLGFLFLLYELLGVVTNLFGGRLGSRFGLNRTLHAGLALQVVALVLLSFQDPGWAEALSVVYVMITQALSGVAKDLTKMSSKSAVKLLAGPGAGSPQSRLFGLVSVLTGSKNALKGIGFFLGGALLGSLGFETSLRSMAAVLFVVLVVVVARLRVDIGRSGKPGRPGRLLSESPAVNRLSVARLFLFGARDLWFVVALPLFLSEEVGWSFEAIGAFLAFWVIGYGIVQSATPAVLRRSRGHEVAGARRWAAVLLIVTMALAVVITDSTDPVGLDPTMAVVGGLIVFGVVFAINSALHSYLILAYADLDIVASEVGFYYSANAAGRLIGTLLSGVAYLIGGMAAALWLASAFVAAAWLVSNALPPLGAAQTRRRVAPGRRSAQNLGSADDG